MPCGQKSSRRSNTRTPPLQGGVHTNRKSLDTAERKQGSPAGISPRKPGGTVQSALKALPEARIPQQLTKRGLPQSPHAATYCSQAALSGQRSYLLRPATHPSSRRNFSRKSRSIKKTIAGSAKSMAARFFTSIHAKAKRRKRFTTRM